MSITACARVDQYRNHKRMCDQSRDVRDRVPRSLFSRWYVRYVARGDRGWIP